MKEAFKALKGSWKRCHWFEVDICAIGGSSGLLDPLNCNDDLVSQPRLNALAPVGGPIF